MAVEFTWEPGLPEHIHRIAADVLEPVAQAVHTDAVRLVPIDTGDLQRSLYLHIDQAGLSARIGSGLDYARYVEYGTENMDAQPYLRPAAYRVRGL
jgi:HK97 gp10 family phage protein